MSIKIIRIEHDDGIGIFVGEDEFGNARNVNVYAERQREKYETLRNRHRDFNNPWEDKLSPDLDQFCAFKSIAQIKKWITSDEFIMLINDGYKIYELCVSDYEEGKDNIIFRKSDIISRKDISKTFI